MKRMLMMMMVVVVMRRKKKMKGAEDEEGGYVSRIRTTTSMIMITLMRTKVMKNENTNGTYCMNYGLIVFFFGRI